MQKIPAHHSPNHPLLSHFWQPRSLPVLQAARRTAHTEIALLLVCFFLRVVIDQSAFRKFIYIFSFSSSVNINARVIIFWGGLKANYGFWSQINDFFVWGIQRLGDTRGQRVMSIKMLQISRCDLARTELSFDLELFFSWNLTIAIERIIIPVHHLICPSSNQIISGTSQTSANQVAFSPKKIDQILWLKILTFVTIHFRPP